MERHLVSQVYVDWQQVKPLKTTSSPRTLYLAPLVFLAHVAEEAPGFPEWFNRHVEPDISMGGFYALNGCGLLVTVVLIILAARSRHGLHAIVMIAWLSFLMLTNGVLHLLGCILFREYVPGTVTAAVLYLPYFSIAAVRICRDFGVPPRAAILAVAVGAVPMIAQGSGSWVLGRRLLW
jgi:hypothetical protein